MVDCYDMQSEDVAIQLCLKDFYVIKITQQHNEVVET
jgi:hypothetical protein